MKKLFMNNIINFVDSNVRQRIDRVSNNNSDFFDQDLLLVERQFEDLKQFCVEAEKRISSLLLSIGSQQTHSSLSSNLTSLTNSAAHDNPPAHQASMSPHSETPVAPCSSPSIGSASQSCSSTAQTGTQPVSTHHAPLKSNLYQQDAGSTLEIAQFLAQDDIRKHKRLPVVSFLKFLVKSQRKLKPDSLLASTLTHSSQLQQQLTKLYIAYEQTIEAYCLKPIQHILEVDAPNVIKLRKLFIKSHNDLESLKVKYNGASQKQQQQQHLQLQAGHFTSTSYTLIQTANSAQQANINKLDHLKKELDEAQTKFEQARDSYATELYVFVCREPELVNLLAKLYQYQADYHQQVHSITQSSLPALTNLMALSPRKPVFGTSLEEHLCCINRRLSLVIEICTHFLFTSSLCEEGLFRIPGSTAKIKKLRSAIDAWFITLSNQSELEYKAQQVGPCRALHAIHDLVKSTIIQELQEFSSTTDIQISQSGQSGSSSSILKEDQANSSNRILSLANASQNDQIEQQQPRIYFDSHTIAGLLKLYLRELPEPLLTYRLYAQWIDATIKFTSNAKDENYDDKSVIELKRVIQQLPKAHYDNLQHLVRFLNLLTSHSDLNKMTATNLAITMAPSLIKAPSPSRCSSTTGVDSSALPTNQRACSNSNQNINDTQAITMSSIGMSASLHASLIESLIRQSDNLFPGQQQFQIPELATREHFSSYQSVGDHVPKSSSPATLSTASTSSFSSGSITSSSTAEQQYPAERNRRGGSIDGMLNIIRTSSPKVEDSQYPVSPSPIPSSTQFQQDRRASPQDPKYSPPPPTSAPPIPPAPIARVSTKYSKDQSHINPHNRQSLQTHPQVVSTSQKPPAPAPPPPPQPSTLRRSHNATANRLSLHVGCQSEGVSSSNAEKLIDVLRSYTSSNEAQDSTSIPISLRGTGTISATSSSSTNNNPNAIRPSVPPPSRPEHNSSGAV